MKHRSGTNKKKDNKIFRNTAMTTKRINVKPKTSRGGIQL